MWYNLFSKLLKQIRPQKIDDNRQLLAMAMYYCTAIMIGGGIFSCILSSIVPICLSVVPALGIFVLTFLIIFLKPRNTDPTEPNSANNRQLSTRAIKAMIVEILEEIRIETKGKEQKTIRRKSLALIELSDYSITIEPSQHFLQRQLQPRSFANLKNKYLFYVCS